MILAERVLDDFFRLLEEQLGFAAFALSLIQERELRSYLRRHRMAGAERLVHDRDGALIQRL